MNCSPPGSSVHGILQARMLEWAAMPSSGGSSRARDWTQISCIAGRFFYQLSYKGSPKKNAGVGCHALLQGIFPSQGLIPGPRVADGFFTGWATREAPRRMLEWAATPSSGGSSRARGWSQAPALQAGSLPAEPRRPRCRAGASSRGSVLHTGFLSLCWIYPYMLTGF